MLDICIIPFNIPKYKIVSALILIPDSDHIFKLLCYLDLK